MKSVLFYLIICVSGGACQKSGSTVPSSIQYKSGGLLVQITGDRDNTNLDASSGANYGCYAVKPAGSNFYTLTGADKPFSVLLVISSANDTLLTTTYGGGSVDVSFRINDSTFGINSGDAMTINITRYSRGTIDGTFSGSISDGNAHQKLITDGILSNLKVYY